MSSTEVPTVSEAEKSEWKSISCHVRGMQILRWPPFCKEEDECKRSRKVCHTCSIFFSVT